MVQTFVFRFTLMRSSTTGIFIVLGSQASMWAEKWLLTSTSASSLWFFLFEATVQPVVILQMKDSLVQELQQKAEKTELLQVELQMLETERVRLSLVEEKLVDILQLLQQLRDLVGQSGPGACVSIPALLRRSSIGSSRVRLDLCCISKKTFSLVAINPPTRSPPPPPPWPQLRENRVPQPFEDMHMDTPSQNLNRRK